MHYNQIVLSDKFSIYDSTMQKLSICVNDNGVVDVEAIIQLSYPCNSYIKLIFKDVFSYHLSWSREYNFYTIESYKLLKAEDGFYYCSFDPEDREASISENDGDVIISKDIELFYSSNKEFTDIKKIESNR